ncbi:MAG: hypothetical protein OK422_02630 [Thaumarchaeota archaeon]|nr:hypothetical protein [Nitrososphaerota archaeon]
MVSPILIFMSWLALPSHLPLDVQTPLDFTGIIQQLAQKFTTAATALLGTLDQSVIAVSRVAYVSTLMLGTLLWATRVERRLGRDLIKGGIVLAVLAEFIFPLIGKF